MIFQFFSSDEYIKNLRKLNVNSYSIGSGAVNSPKQDLIFLSTKIYKVKNYLKILENLVGEGSLILPLQNGFYSFDLLKKAFTKILLQHHYQLLLPTQKVAL